MPFDGERKRETKGSFLESFFLVSSVFLSLNVEGREEYFRGSRHSRGLTAAACTCKRRNKVRRRRERTGKRQKEEVKERMKERKKLRERERKRKKTSS